MHTPPILCVSPAPRPLSAVTETGGAKTWAVPAGATQVAFPLRGAAGDALAGAGGCALTRAAGLAPEVTATLPVAAGTVLQGNDGQAGTGDPVGSSGVGAAVTGQAGDGGASDARTPPSSGTYPLADRMLAVGEGGAGGLPGPRPAGPGGNADPPRQAGRFARDGGATPGDGAGRGASLAGQGYVHARFGGVPVLIAPELAARIMAVREERP